MHNLSYFVLFLAGILGYAALIYRVMNRRPSDRARGTSHIEPSSSMEYLATAQIGRARYYK